MKKKTKRRLGFLVIYLLVLSLTFILTLRTKELDSREDYQYYDNNLAINLE